jgi:uncharacterized protein (TIGR03437 family)
MTPSDWRTIHERYLENSYYPCDFEWKNMVLPNVGIRSRGSQSRSPIKPSIGLDFGKYTSGQRLLGLKSLILRNVNQDASMMHERLAESLFARLGLPHSRESHARLYVNGDYAGVYLIVEAIDSRFLQTQVGEDTGYLYDYTLVSGYRFQYLGADPALYVPTRFDPKTHADNPDTEGLIETIRLVNEASDDQFYSVVSPRIDLDDFVAHAATEQALAQWDGLMGINGMNNFYLYRWSRSRQAMFFVWDQDGAFTSLDWSIWQGTQENVLMRRALNVPQLGALYLDMIRNAADAMGGADGWLAREIDRIYSQIRDSVYEDAFKLCRGAEGIAPCTNEEFEQDVMRLRSFAASRAAILTAEADAAQQTGRPKINLKPDSLTNLGSGDMAVTAGSLARLRVSLPLGGTISAAAIPLPTELAGVTVKTAAGPAQLIEAGPEGIVFVIPEELSCAPQPLVVSVKDQQSSSILADVMPTASGILGVIHADGRIVSAQAPAQAGEWLSVYATAVWPGRMASPPGPVQLLLNGKPMAIQWMGRAPGLMAMQQINFQVPEGIAASDAVPLLITMDSEPGKRFEIAVR